MASYNIQIEKKIVDMADGKIMPACILHFKIFEFKVDFSFFYVLIKIEPKGIY